MSLTSTRIDGAQGSAETLPIPGLRLNTSMSDLTPETLARSVVDRYLKSGDFNGLYLPADADLQVVEKAKELVTGGNLQVMVSEWLCQPKSNPPGLSKPDPLRAKRGVPGNLTGTHLHRCCGHPLEE